VRRLQVSDRRPSASASQSGVLIAVKVRLFWLPLYSYGSFFISTALRGSGAKLDLDMDLLEVTIMPSEYMPTTSLRKAG
jgi:hypothetical protein